MYEPGYILYFQEPKNILRKIASFTERAQLKQKKTKSWWEQTKANLWQLIEPYTSTHTQTCTCKHIKMKRKFKTKKQKQNM